MTPAKLRCLLVDDEPPALDILRTYIEATPMLEIAGSCHHAMAAFDFIQKNQVDLIFLDINMPKLTGIDFLRALPSPPKVIFTTAHRDYAVDGFELGAVDYLLKPYSLDRFLRAVHRAINPEQKQQTIGKETITAENDRFLYVRADRKMVKIMVDEIRYIESLKDYVRIFLPEKQVITKQTITALEEMLPEHDFMRIHRSFIVALNKIDSYNLNSVYIGKTELPIGPLYKHELAKRLNSSL
ncbi:MAG TPA: LytTR family DNA-binding domain-containing protein [Ohtaekwangia sp.]|uniref:LytR/AlgR family response regulator transcription factor n=1 Tax=Ohtaekwangia sp. TaxID=2066019 RepID=UPI002F94FB6C